MKSQLLHAMFVVASLLAGGSALAAEPSLLPARIEQAIRQRVAVGEYPAVVVAVVDGDRSGVYGFGTLANGKAPDAHTVFEIGSATKTFTATLLAEDIVEGKLKLDAPVASLLPGFKLPSRNGKVITLENLATQHSGLPGLPDNLDSADASDPYADYDAARLKDFLARYTLPRDPGASYEYSNLGVGLLGYALAVHAGTSYEGVLKRRIFDPLSMHESGIALDNAMRARLAAGHDERGQPVHNWNFQVLAGAGGIRSTGADMLRYLRANMGAAPSTLYPAMQLAQQQRLGDGHGAERIGLIWMTQPAADGKVIMHNGMTGGYASFLGFTADRKRGVVVLVNAQRSVDDLGFAVLRPDAPLEPARKAIAMSTQALDAYTGSYRLQPQLDIRVFRNGDQLYAQGTGQSAFPILPSAENEFFASMVSIQLSFQRDAKGKVTGMTVHQGGHDLTAPRLSGADAEAAGKQYKRVPPDAATHAPGTGSSAKR